MYIYNCQKIKLNKKMISLTSTKKQNPTRTASSPSTELSPQSKNIQPQPQHTHQNQNHQHRKSHHTTKSFLNPSFIFANVLIFLFAAIFLYQFVYYSKPTYWLIILIVFVVLFIMTIWSYYATVLTNPGNVPFYYGMSDEISDKFIRKYCIICHNFKPQRAHHCSICGKCILNMDHHCPWVNNCIGFRNRKYFILFLIYICVGLVFAAVMQIMITIPAIQTAISTSTTDIHFAIKILMTLLTISIGIALIAFTIFHIKLVLSNTTTLQNLIQTKNIQKQHKQIKQKIQNYDVGNYQNFMQVFGESCIYWLFPVKGHGPKGNGTSWPKSIGNNRNYLTNEYQTAPINGRNQQLNWNSKNARV